MYWGPLMQKDVFSLTFLHSHSRALSTPHSQSPYCSIVLHSPPGHMKNESGPGEEVVMGGVG